MPPQTMPPLALLAYVQELKREETAALFYEESFWTMVAIPVSLFGMALIATPFVFGAERSGGAGRQMMIGGMIGIGFLLIQQITAYLGLILALNPVISGLAPSVLLLISGLYTLAERDTPDGKKSLLQKAGIGAVLRPQ
jgi:lipopolysaccharide export system permease protein